MDTVILLCDHAEAINGKLYIMGGGWTICSPGPRNMAVAVRIKVPWTDTNEKHKFALFLQDADGKTIELGDPPKPVMQAGEFEVGRPPGAVPGSDLDFTAVFGFIGLPLDPEKGYRWQLEIDGEDSGHASFRTRTAQNNVHKS